MSWISYAVGHFSCIHRGQDFGLHGTFVKFDSHKRNREPLRPTSAVMIKRVRGGYQLPHGLPPSPDESPPQNVRCRDSSSRSPSPWSCEMVNVSVRPLSSKSPKSWTRTLLRTFLLDLFEIAYRSRSRAGPVRHDAFHPRHRFMLKVGIIEYTRLHGGT
jgi:hypothetical protein